MTLWTNQVAIAAGRNGTDSHDVDPATGTVVAGEAFTPTAGRLLVCVAGGPVTSTTSTGWTLPDGGSAVGFTGLYVWTRTAAGGDTIHTEHNASDYPVIFHFFEFAAGSTFLGSAARAGVAYGADGPNLAGSAGASATFGVACQTNSVVSGFVAWDLGEEIVDHSAPATATDGYTYSITYVAGVAATFAATSEPSRVTERLVFAVAPPFDHPIPVETGHEYTPISPEDVQVGDYLLAVKEVHGEVTAANLAGGEWTYGLDVTRIDGATDTDTAVFPDVPTTMGDDWWLRYRLNRREPKLAEGTIFTDPDGGKWIYPDDGTGKLVRYLPSTATQFRGEITTDPRDLYVDPDTQFDWLPVHDGADVETGDVISYGQVLMSEVDEITVTDHGTYTRRDFRYDGATFAWFDTAPEPVTAGVKWTFLLGTPNVAPDSKFEAADGSKWIYSGTEFVCWKAGFVYPALATFKHVETTLLTPI